MNRINPGDQFYDGETLYEVVKPAIIGSDWLCKIVNGNGLLISCSNTTILRGHTNPPAPLDLKQKHQMKL